MTVAPVVSPIATAVQQPTPEEQAQYELAMQEQSEQLVKQAQSKDPTQRLSALMNLSSVGLKDDPTVDEALRTAMNDKDANVRTQAIMAIAQRGSENVDAQLSQAIQDKDVNVRVTVKPAPYKKTFPFCSKRSMIVINQFGIWQKASWMVF